MHGLRRCCNVLLAFGLQACAHNEIVGFSTCENEIWGGFHLETNEIVC
jgi:hypothetical protein